MQDLAPKAPQTSAYRVPPSGIGHKTCNPNPGTKIVLNDPLDWFLAGASANSGSNILAARLVHGAPVSRCWCDASPPISFSGIP